MMMFKDMKERFGTLAPGMLEEKKAQENAKPPGDTNTYWMLHPDTKAEDTWYIHGLGLGKPKFHIYMLYQKMGLTNSLKT